MKTRIVKSLPEPQNIVTLAGHAANIDKYYGVWLPSSKSKGFICSNSFQGGPYEVRPLYGLTEGNKVPCYTGKTLLQCLEKLVNDNLELYVFDTHKELLSWLAE